MNKALLVGTVKYPPRFNETDYGAVLNLMIECRHRYKDNDGVIQERSQTLKVALWGKLAELNREVERYDTVSLEGRIQNKKVQDKGGAERWETEIVAASFERLNVSGDKPTDSKEHDEQQRESTGGEFTDDDIPF